MRTRLSLVLSVVMVLSACGGGVGPAKMEFIELIPAQPRIGDVVTVRFRLLDERGNPLAGAPVSYRLGAANEGVNLNPVESVSIKGNGFAETQLIASNRVNSVIVIATSGDKEISSPPITFAGSKPNGRQFTFQCGPIGGPGTGGRHAIGAYDKTRNLIAGISIDCTAHVADRNGDGVEGALVSFMTEAGAISPTDTSQSNLVGDATVLHKTSYPLPMDVDPGNFTWVTAGGDAANTGEYLAPLWMHPFAWIEDPRRYATMATPPLPDKREPRRPDPIREKPDGSGRYLNNPRDNLVSMIAVTAGEEGFTDTNNDGIYNEGEPFDDLTEPFVDSNDNGTWDDFERFIDVNNSNGWDGKNGRWDANTLIWVQERLLWTGIPADEDVAPVGNVPGFKSVFAPINPPVITLVCPDPTPGASCSQAGVEVPASTPRRFVPINVTAYLADPWFNSIARNGDGDGCTIPSEAMSPVKVRGSSEQGVAFTYPAGSFLTFAIGDARDPNLPPINQIPVRSPPVGFKNTIICTYTAAPANAYITKLAAGTVEGTIQ